MGRNGPCGLSLWAHNPPMGSKDGPKAQPIRGLGWVGLWALWAMQRSRRTSILYTSVSGLSVPLYFLFGKFGWSRVNFAGLNA